MSRKKLSVKDIRSIYREHMKQRQGIDPNATYNLWGEGILRKISYYPAWFFLRLGISANLVTGLSFAISLLGCTLIISGINWSMTIGALLLNIWAMLDYVDGQVARCSDSPSDYGRFLDFLVENVVAILMFTSVGIGVYTRPDPWLNSLSQMFLGIGLEKGLFLILGGWASAFYIFPLYAGCQFERFGIGEFVSFTNQLKAGRWSGEFVRIVGFNLFNISGLVMPVLLVATVLEFLSVVLFLWSLIHTFGAIYMVANLANEARHRFRAI